MDETTKPKTVIAEDIKIVGTIECESDIQFDGKLEGDLHCTGRTTIGKTAVIKGNSSVDSISVMGEVSGNIVAKDRIELKATARVNGDIKAKRLTVEDGVTFVGRSEVNPAGVPTTASKPSGAATPAPEQRPQGTPHATSQQRK